LKGLDFSINKQYKCFKTKTNCITNNPFRFIIGGGWLKRRGYTERIGEWWNEMRESGRVSMMFG
jgi:hypothetical protein